MHHMAFAMSRMPPNRGGPLSEYTLRLDRQSMPIPPLITAVRRRLTPLMPAAAGEFALAIDGLILPTRMRCLPRHVAGDNTGNRCGDDPRPAMAYITQLRIEPPDTFGTE